MNDKVKEAMIQKAGQGLIANRFELVNGRLDKIVFEPVTTDMAEFALAENADLKARLEAAAAATERVCEWTMDNDIADMPERWTAPCGVQWWFEYDDTTETTQMLFCPNCRHRIARALATMTEEI